MMKILMGLCLILYTNVALAGDTDGQFLNYLEDAYENQTVTAENTEIFNKRTFKYWLDHAVDYNKNPEKYSKSINLYHQNQVKFARDRSIKIDRFEKTIENFRRFDKRNTLAKNPILFVGSSSIVFWETAVAFKDLPVINRGFGGASLPEVLYYYDDVIKKHNPSIMVVYSDIDVERGSTPEFAVDAFKILVERVQIDFPDTEILLLAMKPTLIDDVLGKTVRENKIITNQLLSDYSDTNDKVHYVDIATILIDEGRRLKDGIFISDGMHLNASGYALWNPIIREIINKIRN